MSKGLTLTMIFQAGSLNYGEGFGNISELKKVSRNNGQVYTYVSRQCLRYDMVRLGHELFGWNLQTVDKEQRTIQFKSDATIEESEEMDLFGYMKTVKKANATTRSAVVRVTPAISLEPYRNDIDYLNNMGLAQRIRENKDVTNDLAQIENHISFYTYTITIDLDRIGVDQDIVLSKEIRAKRVKELLTILNLLNRNIRGRQENLSPLFVIGGIYEMANPFFYGRIRLDQQHNDYALHTGVLEDVLEKRILHQTVQEATHLGLSKGIFANEEEIMELVHPHQTHSVQGMFDYLISAMDAYYGEVYEGA